MEQGVGEGCEQGRTLTENRGTVQWTVSGLWRGGTGWLGRWGLWTIPNEGE